MSSKSVKRILVRLGKLWLLGLYEAFGMGIFTFVVTYVAAMSDFDPLEVDAIYIPLTLTLVIALLAPTTGGHVNPAVTVTLALCGIIGTERVKGAEEFSVLLCQSVVYLAFQFAGALLGGIYARWYTGYEGALFTVFEQAVSAYDDGNWGKFLLSEFMGTLLLTFSVTCLVYRGSFGECGPLLVGLTVYVSATILGSWSGGMYNPGISFGMIVSGIIDMTSEQKEELVFDDPRNLFAWKAL